MWKKIVAVVALLQFVCAQDPTWRYDKPIGTFGASAKLVCTFPGTVTIKDKNNKIIRDNRPKYELTQSQVDTTLKITNLGIDDCGEYHCIAGNKRATLVLGLTVQIEEPKSEYDLANGDKGTVPIVVKGCSFSEITWQKKDTSGSFKSLIVLDNGVSSGPRHDSGRMSINPANGNLIINNVQSSDAGSYQIVHSDGSNELTKQTTVNTGDKPIMEKKPVASYDVTEGEPLTLPCTFKAAVTSSSWEHTKDDGTTKNKITSSSGRVKVSGTNLEIGSAQISDKGSYTCSGTNKFGTSTTTTKINEVIVVPRITSNPVDVSQGKGGTVVLNCTAIGTPVPNVGWTKNGKPLGDQKLGKNIYTINPLKSVDGGEYTCLAHNGAVVKGKKKNDTRTINIIVFSKPTINKETTAGPLKMVLKEKKTIICKADGLPLPSIVFKKDNKVLTGAKNVASTSQSITKSLDYMPSSQSDFGTIVCTASNQQGNASKEIVIQAINKPSKLSKPQTVTVKMNSVSLKWQKPTNDGGDTIVSYTVRITDIKAKTNDTKTYTTTTGTVNNLKNGTDYSFEVAAKNRAGLGNYSSAVTATTLNKPSKPSKPKIVIVNKNSVSLEWEKPTDDGGDTIVSYTVRITDIKAKTDDTKSYTTTTGTVDNLKGGTDYSFEVAAENSAGLGDYSSSVTATTHQLTKPGKILNLVQGNKMKNEISLNWNEPQDKGGAQQLTYNVTYCENGNTSSCLSQTTNVTSITLKNLKQDTKYTIVIIASNSAQHGESSKDLIFETTGPVTKKVKPKRKGLSGGAVAGIIVAVIIIILIVTDLFCCFFNTCGLTYYCYITFCAGKAGAKYAAAEGTDKETDKETAELKEVKVKPDEKEEEKEDEKNNSEKV